MPAQLPPPTQRSGGDHPLAPILRDAVAGAWPPADGAVVHLPAWRAGVSGIVALTGRAYLCTDRSLSLDALSRAGADGFGGATLPQAVLDIAGAGSLIDCLDVLLAGLGRGRPGRLVDRPDLRDSPRAAAARRSRSHVQVLGYADTSRRDLVTLSRGVAGLPSSAWRRLNREGDQRFSSMRSTSCRTVSCSWPASHRGTPAPCGRRFGPGSS